MTTWIVVTGWAAKLVLLLLFCLSIWSFAVIVDRKKALKSTLQTQDAQNIKSLISKMDMKSVRELTLGHSSLLAQMIHVAVSVDSQNPEKVERMIKSFITEKRIELEKGFTVLATLGSNAPFIGLFGTVLGIIQAFGILGEKQSGNASVMTGISEALIATAVGLFVAIPAVIAYNIFSRQLKIILTECDSIKDFYISHLIQPRENEK